MTRRLGLLLLLVAGAWALPFIFGLLWLLLIDRSASAEALARVHVHSALLGSGWALGYVTHWRPR